ncbi:alanine or glycine:cation symporter, AGCS family [Eubacterium pyruvativorans]|uniref:Alanine or glycine:cation symporter, AGCS family n=1 Tax=Eubacterium pyruvativorans TaxID=155865 RepID=A0A1I7G211_9FIRM|nr:amino acid carrier protein [Eubacterium pyruvativorans]SFN99271.1 alanine or glycine:cation symporter, AGCS family [Eubacterium pyruvativorans]SFU42459.1 alanine or glycine:cation symporter, AGCS family [Eubacterium pyruvativorans]
MESISKALFAIDDFVWGTPMTVIVLMTGMILSIRFGFRYQRKIRFNFRNTFGSMFGKGEGEGTVSGFRAACTALANTVGTGNISGVATAIVSGGPGALVWMWVSAFFGMSTKACEIIIGQRYREHYRKSMDEYVCDRSFVLKNALGWKRGAVVLAVFCFLFGPWTCSVQTEAVTGSMRQAFGLTPVYAVAAIGLTCLLTIWGGLRRISGVMSKAVPIMAALYILMGLGVILMNLREVPDVIMLILKSAVTPAAPLGGFAGASVRDAVRFGVARGIYSNDAGTGYGMIAHAPARTDHPVRQSVWGWGEIFLDTIVICSITAFTIIFTGAYHKSSVTSGALTTVAFTEAYGPAGGKMTAVAIAVFAWTTIIGMYYTCEKSVNYVFGDSEANRRMMPVYMIYYMIPSVVLYRVKADTLWAFTDILSAMYVAITIFIIIARHREIFRLFDDFWKRYLPAKERGENPPYVVFDCAEENPEEAAEQAE